MWSAKPQRNEGVLKLPIGLSNPHLFDHRRFSYLLRIKLYSSKLCRRKQSEIHLRCIEPMKERYQLYIKDCGMLGWKNLLTTIGPITWESGRGGGNMAVWPVGLRECHGKALRCSCPVWQPSGVGHEVFQKRKCLASRPKLDLGWLCHDSVMKLSVKSFRPLYGRTFFWLLAPSCFFRRVENTSGYVRCHKVWLGLGKWFLFPK